MIRNDLKQRCICLLISGSGVWAPDRPPQSFHGLSWKRRPLFLSGWGSGWDSFYPIGRFSVFHEPASYQFTLKAPPLGASNSASSLFRLGSRWKTAVSATPLFFGHDRRVRNDLGVTVQHTVKGIHFSSVPTSEGVGRKPVWYFPEWRCTRRSQRSQLYLSTWLGREDLKKISIQLMLPLQFAHN